MSGENKKHKRKIDKGRLAMVLAACIALVLCLCLAVTSLFHWVSSKMTSSSPIVLESGEELEMVELDSLKTRIEDSFNMKYLLHLKDDIQTYIYNNQLADLKTQILGYLEENNVDSSKIAWAVQDLTTYAYIESDNAATNFTAASTYKLPLSMLWYQKLANGSASLEDTFVFTEEMTEEEDEENPDQPIGKKFKLGDTITLDQLLEAVAVYSDNIAGHILFENLGGWTSFKVQAASFSATAQDKEFTGYSNVLNPHYTMDLVRTLYETEGVYDDLKYYLSVAAPDMFLNLNASYGFVQKVGNIESVRNVIGYMPSMFPFSISVYSDIDAEEGEQIIADIGTICYNYFLEQYESGFYDGYPEETRIALSTLSSIPQMTLPYIADLPESERYTAQLDKDSSSQDSAAQPEESDSDSDPDSDSDSHPENQ